MQSKDRRYARSIRDAAPRHIQSRGGTPYGDNVGTADRRRQRRRWRPTTCCIRFGLLLPQDRQETRCSSPFGVVHRNGHSTIEQRAAVFSRLNPLAVAIQQPHAERLLQVRNRLRNIRLKGVQVLCAFPMLPACATAIWPVAPLCRPRHASLGRSLIRRGRYASSSAFLGAAGLTYSHV